MDHAEFRLILQKLKAGDPEAARQLLGSFEHEIRLIVRARLPRALRPHFDSMDFVQAIWKSILTDQPDQLDQLQTPDQFQGYLAGVACNKIRSEYRKRTRTQKYNLKREQPLVVRRASGDELVQEIQDPDPTPSQRIQAEDCWNQMLAHCSKRAAEIIRLRRDGLTFEEIARRLGLSDRSVRRVLDSVRQQLERQPWA
jgi:RNA polymerase sigma-70 factor (ECF subfamily)